MWRTGEETNADVERGDDSTNTATAIVPVLEVPDDIELQEFKDQVRTWLELDNTIRKLQGMARERRVFKQQLTQKITNFMTRYNIEDLSTREGCLRYKVTYVKKPVTQGTIKSSIQTYFDNSQDPDMGRRLTEAVFGSGRTHVERTSLRRLRTAQSTLTIDSGR